MNETFSLPWVQVMTFRISSFLHCCLVAVPCSQFREFAVRDFPLVSVQSWFLNPGCRFSSLRKAWRTKGWPTLRFECRDDKNNTKAWRAQIRSCFEREIVTVADLSNNPVTIIRIDGVHTTRPYSIAYNLWVSFPHDLGVRNLRSRPFLRMMWAQLGRTPTTSFSL